eukprot:Hpha_TRINITY_DN26058_c0_g1::TRINITY_DN26058_c0_g1_i1::g.115285::m.115285
MPFIPKQTPQRWGAAMERAHRQSSWRAALRLAVGAPGLVDEAVSVCCKARRWVKGLKVATTLGGTTALTTVCKSAAEASAANAALSIADRIFKVEAGRDAPDPVAVRTALRTLRRTSSGWRRVLVVYRKAPRLRHLMRPSAAAALGKAQRWELALRVLEKDSTPPVLAAVLRQLGETGKWRMAVGLSLAGDPLTVSASIAACADAVKWEVAVRLLSTCPHSTKVRSAALSACGAAENWRFALGMVNDARGEAEGNAATAVCAHVFAWVPALRLLAVNKESPVRFTSAVAACCRAAKWQMAVRLLAENQPVSRLHAWNYEATARACRRAWRADKVPLVLYLMRGAGLDPPPDLIHAAHLPQ